MPFLSWLFFCVAFIFSLHIPRVASDDDADCLFLNIYPRQYIAYYVPQDEINLDGLINEAAWDEVPFTQNFVDISTNTTPYLNTKAKIRWSDDFLFIAAILDDPNIW